MCACQFEDYFSKDNRELVIDAASREKDWETLIGGKFHFNLKTFLKRREKNVQGYHQQESLTGPRRPQVEAHGRKIS